MIAIQTIANPPANVLPQEAVQDPGKTALPKAKTSREMINEIAFAALKELAAGMLMASIASIFLATPASASVFFISAIAIVILNVAIRSVSVYLAHRIAKMPPEKNKTVLKTIIIFCEYLAPLNFSILANSTTDTLIHEGGHALAASALYQNPKPKIEILPFKGGVTSWYMTPLSKLGEFFGAKNSRLIVSAAGPAAGILASTVELGIAHSCRKKHPRLSRYLNVMAIVNIAQHVLYAASAFAVKNAPGHDFVFLWLGGIHPVASIVTMVALPLIVKGSLFLYDHLRKPKKARRIPAQAA